MYNGHRVDFHRIIYEYAISLGIKVHMGQRIASYQEDDIAAKIPIHSGHCGAHGPPLVAYNLITYHAPYQRSRESCD